MTHKISVTLPDWIDSAVNWDKVYSSDIEKMSLAVELSKQNVLNKTGGPFGSAIFEKNTNRLISVGVNQVVPLNNSSLHGEIVAIMIAQNKLKTFSLRDKGLNYELFTSCEPCAMCLGAILYSGVKRFVCAASEQDARSAGFDEGPVFDQSYSYLKNKGIEVVKGVCTEEAKKVFISYTELGGKIYT